MTQTKAKSMVEVLVNVGSGFCISYMLWLFVVPVLFGIETRPAQGLGVTALYTVAAIVRSFVVRRAFNG